MSLKFAVIGCQHAHIGLFIGEMIKLGYECVGLYEPENIKLAEEMCRKFGVQRIMDVETIWKDETVQIVGCASVNIDKINVIERCEKFGKNIMIDKPAVCNRKDLDRLQNVMQRGRIHIGMLLTERFRPSIYTLKQKLDRGELGEIVHVAMRKPHKLMPDRRPKWHFSKSQNGGIIVDLFVHDFDLLRWFTGSEVLRTQGFVAKNILPEYPDFYDVASLQVVMEEQQTAQFYADWHYAEKSWTWGDCRIFITGTEGVAELRLEGDPLVDKSGELFLLVTHQNEMEQVSLEQPKTTITEDFLSRINGQKGLITHEDIWASTCVTIDADEQVDVLNAFTKRASKNSFE